MSDRRQLAKRFAHEIVDAHPENYKPGMVCVVIVNEVEAAEGALEIDASTECAASITERGGELIVEFSKRLREAVTRICEELARDSGAEAINRDDLAIEVPGERPKA